MERVYLTEEDCNKIEKEVEDLCNNWNYLIKLKGDKNWIKFKKFILLQRKHNVIDLVESVNRLSKYIEYGKSI